RRRPKGGNSAARRRTEKNQRRKGADRRAEIQGQFNFRSRVIPVLLCNSVPYLTDLSYGMMRRLQVVPCKRTFKDQSDDKDLFDRIASTELPGVLNRAIEGWQRLHRRRGFKLPRDVIEAGQQWLV